MSLRTLLLLLLLFNLVAFAGARMGWLGSTAPRGEPERLTNQIRPDVIELGNQPPRPAPRPAPPSTPSASTAPPPTTGAPPAATSPPPATAPIPATAAVTGCTAFIVRGTSALNEAAKLAQGTEGAVSMSQQTLEEPSNWRVRIPPAASLEAAEQRLRNLRERNISDLFLVREEGPHRWAISLGLYSSENGAQQRLNALREQGVSSAEILPGAVGRYWLEFRGQQGALEALVARLQDQLGQDAQRPCSP